MGGVLLPTDGVQEQGEDDDGASSVASSVRPPDNTKGPG